MFVVDTFIPPGLPLAVLSRRDVDSPQSIGVLHPQPSIMSIPAPGRRWCRSRKGRCTRWQGLPEGRHDRAWSISTMSNAIQTACASTDAWVSPTMPGSCSAANGLSRPDPRVIGQPGAAPVRPSSRQRPKPLSPSKLGEARLRSSRRLLLFGRSAFAAGPQILSDDAIEEGWNLALTPRGFRFERSIRGRPAGRWGCRR